MTLRIKYHEVSKKDMCNVYGKWCRHGFCRKYKADATKHYFGLKTTIK